MTTSNLIPAVQSLRTTFQSGVTRNLDWRRRQLGLVLSMLEKRYNEFSAALSADLGRSRMECEVVEIQGCIAATKEAIKNLKAWSAPRPAAVPLMQMKGISKAYVEPRPKGVVLIIAPWNYPLTLCISPLVSALAAGNVVVVKPSEVSSNMSEAITRYFTEDLDGSAVVVAPGDASVASFLLNDIPDSVGAWAHIFYTGNGTVARIVAAAAARHLTPTTLELGGKSPTYISDDADVDLAARRVAWGKLTNNGQTCIAPDYVLCHPRVAAAFTRKVKENMIAFYGEDPKASADYGRIVSARHYERICALVDDVAGHPATPAEPAEDAAAAPAGAVVRVIHGGPRDAETRYIAPVIVEIAAPVFTDGATPSARAAAARTALQSVKVMQEEIFGPVLVVATVPDMATAAAFVNAGETPLATYVFGGSGATAAWLEAVDSGTACANEVLMQFATSSIPFGGVGGSGYGMAHGQFGFDTFSHLRGTLDKAKVFDVAFRYPPYSDKAVDLLKKLM